jgi:hypothetical protein
MLQIYCVYLLIWIAGLAIWTSLSSYSPSAEAITTTSFATNGTILYFDSYQKCSFGKFNSICVGYMVVNSVAGVYLTYTVRHVPSAYNESKWISYAIYNYVVIGIVLV